jgi:uncharacterized protein (DUF433 family)
VPTKRISIEPGQPPVACIRDTKIKVWTVYRALVFHGMTDHDVLQKHPALEREDLAAVREYIATTIKSRTHDEITGRPVLPKNQLVHGKYYRGRCRHSTVARWNNDEQCFYHWREKITFVYMETIKYPTDEEEPWWDCFDVVEELPVCKIDIPFDCDAVFMGNRDDLFEFHEEMWRRIDR